MILTMQLVIFTQDFLRDPAAFGQDFCDNAGVLGSPTTNKPPIPEDACTPNNMPLFMANDAKTGTSINFSRERIDMFLNKPDAHDTINICELFYEKARGAVQYIVKQRNIGRVGIIVTQFTQKNNPDKYLSRYFSKLAKIGKGSEITFRFNTGSEFRSIKTNHVLSIESVENFIIDGDSMSGYFVVNDRNTHYANNGISKDILLSYLDFCQKEIIHEY